VIAAEQHRPAGDRAPLHVRTAAGLGIFSPADEVGERRSPRDAAEREHTRRSQLTHGRASCCISSLVGHWLVLRGCAAAGRRDDAPTGEPSPCRTLRRLVRESGAVAGRRRGVAAPVAVNMRRSGFPRGRRRKPTMRSVARGSPNPAADGPIVTREALTSSGTSRATTPARGPHSTIRDQGFQRVRAARAAPPAALAAAGHVWADPASEPALAACALACGVRGKAAPAKRPRPAFSSPRHLERLPPKSFRSLGDGRSPLVVARSTKANPRDRPVSLSVMI